MVTLNLLLVILALICLGAASVGVPASRVNLGWLGLFLWLLSSVLRV